MHIHKADYYLRIYIYNSYIMFPEFFKIAKVIPLHKKGNTNILDNFRPIILLPQFSKMY